MQARYSGMQDVVGPGPFPRDRVVRAHGMCTKLATDLEMLALHADCNMCARDCTPAKAAEWQRVKMIFDSTAYALQTAATTIHDTYIADIEAYEAEADAQLADLERMCEEILGDRDEPQTAAAATVTQPEYQSHRHHELMQEASQLAPTGDEAGNSLLALMQIEHGASSSSAAAAPYQKGKGKHKSKSGNFYHPKGKGKKPYSGHANNTEGKGKHGRRVRT